MTDEDQLAARLHCVYFSESETSDTNEDYSDTDEELNALRPPPIPINPQNTVKVSKFEIVCRKKNKNNVLKNVSSNTKTKTEIKKTTKAIQPKKNISKNAKQKDPPSKSSNTKNKTEIKKATKTSQVKNHKDVTIISAPAPSNGVNCSYANVLKSKYEPKSQKDNLASTTVPDLENQKKINATNKKRQRRRNQMKVSCSNYSDVELMRLEQNLSKLVQQTMSVPNRDSQQSSDKVNKIKDNLLNNNLYSTVVPRSQNKTSPLDNGKFVISNNKQRQQPRKKRPPQAGDNLSLNNVKKITQQNKNSKIANQSKMERGKMTLLSTDNLKDSITTVKVPVLENHECTQISKGKGKTRRWFKRSKLQTSNILNVIPTGSGNNTVQEMERSKMTLPSSDNLKDSTTTSKVPVLENHECTQISKGKRKKPRRFKRSKLQTSNTLNVILNGSENSIVQEIVSLKKDEPYSKLSGSSATSLTETGGSGEKQSTSEILEELEMFQNQGNVLKDEDVSFSVPNISLPDTSIGSVGLTTMPFPLQSLPFRLMQKQLPKYFIPSDHKWFSTNLDVECLELE